MRGRPAPLALLLLRLPVLGLPVCRTSLVLLLLLLLPPRVLLLLRCAQLRMLRLQRRQRQQRLQWRRSEWRGGRRGGWLGRLLVGGKGVEELVPSWPG